MTPPRKITERLTRREMLELKIIARQLLAG